MEHVTMALLLLLMTAVSQSSVLAMGKRRVKRQGGALHDGNIGTGITWFNTRYYGPLPNNPNDEEPVYPDYWLQFTRLAPFAYLKGRTRPYYLLIDENTMQVKIPPGEPNNTCYVRTLGQDAVNITYKYEQVSTGVIYEITSFQLNNSTVYPFYFYCDKGTCCDSDCCIYTTASVINGLVLTFIIIFVILSIIYGAYRYIKYLHEKGHIKLPPMPKINMQALKLPSFNTSPQSPNTQQNAVVTLGKRFRNVLKSLPAQIRNRGNQAPEEHVYNVRSAMKGAMRRPMEEPFDGLNAAKVHAEQRDAPVPKIEQYDHSPRMLSATYF